MHIYTFSGCLEAQNLFQEKPILCFHFKSAISHHSWQSGKIEYITGSSSLCVIMIILEHR